MNLARSSRCARSCRLAGPRSSNRISGTGVGFKRVPPHSAAALPGTLDQRCVTTFSQERAGENCRQRVDSHGKWPTTCRVGFVPRSLQLRGFGLPRHGLPPCSLRAFTGALGAQILCAMGGCYGTAAIARHSRAPARAFRAAAPKPKVCGFVDNSPAANRDACRGKRFAFPTAHPFADKLNRPPFVLYQPSKVQHTREIEHGRRSRRLYSTFASANK